MIDQKFQEDSIQQAKRLSDWFSVSVEIRLFGKIIWFYVWPPKK